MNLEQEINMVTAYLDNQGLLVSQVEFGKFGNGTAYLEFKFANNDHTNDQIKVLLNNFAKKSVHITNINFVPEKLDLSLTIAQLACKYDFTQELNIDEVEKLSAAKGAGDKSYYTMQSWTSTDSMGRSMTLKREILKDKNGKYYATQWYDVSTTSMDRADQLRGKSKEISKAEADSKKSSDYKDFTIAESC